jgi:hypothetical protein
MKKFIDATVALLTICSFASTQALAAAPSLAGKDMTLVEGADDLTETHTAEYVLRRYKGERLIPVRLLGGVKSPGTYYVPQGTDLVTILAAAGGVEANADPTAIHYNHAVNLTSSTLDLKKAMQNDASQNPVFAANDSVFVEQKTPLISTNTLLVLTTLSLIISIALGSKNLFNSNSP